MTRKKMTKEFKAARFVNKGYPDNVIAKRLGMTIKQVTAIREGITATTLRQMLMEDEVDMVNSPAHYTQGGIETYDFIRAKKLGYELGNVVKYVTRAPYKGNHLEDLKKARWYLDAAISNIEEESK
jgi:hypothetical protein